MKPDWLCYVRPWSKKIDLALCEVKSPGKSGSADVSDFVKLGVEMKAMLNKLVGIIGIDDAAVFGILVEGK